MHFPTFNAMTCVAFYSMRILIDEHTSEAEDMLQQLDAKSFPEVILQLITLKR